MMGKRKKQTQGDEWKRRSCVRQENVYEKRKNKIEGQISERTDRFRIYM